MEKLQVTAGLELLLQTAEGIKCKCTVEGPVVTLERELEIEEYLDLELSGAKFKYLF